MIPLTHRQNEIAQLLLNGHSNKEIAWQLKIAVQTVKFHVTRIYKRTEVKRRGEFFAKFMHNRLFEIDRTYEYEKKGEVLNG